MPLTPLADLLARPRQAPEWLVEDLLLVGGVSLLVAKPKVGKSTLSRMLALAVGQGTPFLRRATQQGPVIYVQFEDSVEMVTEHFHRLGATTEPIYTYIAAESAGLAGLAEAIARHQPRLTIVDTLFKLLAFGDGNDYAQVSRAMAPLLALGRETGCHIQCLHHAGKTEREGADAILGSTALFGAVDTVVSLKGSGDHRTIATTQRYGPRLDATRLEFDPATGWLELAGAATSPTDDALARRIEAVCTTPQTVADLVARLDVARSRVDRAVLRLVAAGTLARLGTGLRGDPYRYLCAAATAQPGLLGELSPSPRLA
jgi:hypothetical protein